jgi:hypothetical protein
MTLARTIKGIRTRASIRRWRFRQRNLAAGAWDRFREALAFAKEAYAIDAATADALVAEGFATDPRGSLLEPPRRIVWITEARAATLGAPRLALRLDEAMLSSPILALVPF